MIAIADTLPRTGHSRRTFPVLGFEGLMSLSDPEWLIEGVLPWGIAAEVYGPPGAGKSFLCLDWMLSIATGTSWQGCEVRKGLVVYIAAEGVLGYKVRTSSWVEHHGMRPDENARWIPEAVQLNSPRDIESLMELFREFDADPVLVVFDTLSRCNVGADENAARDMSKIILAVDQIRTTFGSTVLLVHHSGKSGDSERGSNAIRAAMDVMIAVRPGDSQTFTVTCEKMKDAEPFFPMRFRLQKVATSCVLDRLEDLSATRAPSGSITKTLPALRVLASGQMTLKEWELAGGGAHGTLSRHRDMLLENGLIHQDGRVFSVTDEGFAMLHIDPP
jgi:KaiC/GvpD/RAD55 family RecA-like ATPase